MLLRLNLNFIVNLIILLQVDLYANSEIGFQLYANHKYDKAIDQCKNGRDSFDRMITAVPLPNTTDCIKILSNLSSVLETMCRFWRDNVNC